MTKNKDDSDLDRLVDVAQEIEKRFDIEDAKDAPGAHESEQGLDESERQELARFKGALAFLNRVRENIAASGDESATAEGDSTKADWNSPAHQVVHQEAPSSDTFDSIKQVGRFEIQKVLGQGGFARVFLARDPRLDRLVALKVPKPTVLFSEESQARFDREAHAAALLSHPNIVPVYESGSAGPVHYIVSGYCAGQSLGSWFDSKDRKIECHLAAQIICRLAEAVQHAHQRGIIHRDLKPGNVLLESEDVQSADNEAFLDSLRITDFGLAKVALTENDQALTREGAIVGTPAYMSPEQARGEAEIDSTSDIYSLGVMLYELLTGQPPHLGDTHIATMRAVESDEPTDPRKLRPEIPRDLEAICLKALSKSKTDRYDTAFALADDLQSWMDGRAVSARSITPLQRMGRWVKRNPAIAASLAFAFASLLIGLIATNWQWQNSLANLAEAEQQKDRAERHLNRVEESIDTVIRELAVSLKEVPGMDTLREKVLLQVMEIQQELIAEEADHPLVQTRTVQAYLRLAEIQRLLGNRHGAMESVEQALALIENADPDSEHFVSLQISHVELLVERAQRWIDERQHAKAIPELKLAVTMADELQEDSFPEQVAILRVQTRRLLGVCLERTQQFEEAEKAYEGALSLDFQVGSDHQDQLELMRGSTLNSLAILMKRTGRLEKAKDLYTQAAITLNALRNRSPHRPDYHYYCALVEYNLGNMYFVEKQYEQADPHYDEAVSAFGTLRNINPENALYPIHWISASGMRAATKARVGQFDEAQKGFDATIATAKQYPQSFSARSDLLRAYNNLARMQHEDLGELDQAETTLQAVVEECKVMIDENPHDLTLQKSLSVAYANLVEIYSERSDWMGATDYADKQLEAILPAYQANPQSRDFERKTVTALNDLARVSVNTGRLDDAFEFAARIAGLNEGSSELAYRSARSFAGIVDQLELIKAGGANVYQSETDSQIEIARLKALAQLQAAIDAGFTKRTSIEEDSAWDKFRGSPEFQAILEAIAD